MQAIQAYEGGAILIFVKDVCHFPFCTLQTSPCPINAKLLKTSYFSLHSYIFSADTEPKSDFAPNLIHHTQLRSASFLYICIEAQHKLDANLFLRSCRTGRHVLTMVPTKNISSTGEELCVPFPSLIFASLKYVRWRFIDHLTLKSFIKHKSCPDI